MSKLGKSLVAIGVVAAVSGAGVWALVSDNFGFGGKTDFQVTQYGITITGEIWHGENFVDDYFYGGVEGTTPESWIFPEVVLTREEPTVTYSFILDNTNEDALGKVKAEPTSEVPAAFSLTGGAVGAEGTVYDVDLDVLESVEYKFVLTLESFETAQEFEIGFRIVIS